jgi:catechol 2,3-dioxygenase-like lactoylglutathione lyase family enzyme
MITGVSHACFVVNDLDHSIEFYAEKLGLPVAFEFKNDEGDVTGVYLHAGARSFIELFEGEPEQTPRTASFKHICLEVDDMDATVAELEDRGVEVRNKKLGEDGAWQAWLKDPDGNDIELHHFTAESLQTAALTRLQE